MNNPGAQAVSSLLFAIFADKIPDLYPVGHKNPRSQK